MFPSWRTYAPRPTFSARHSGSRGTDTSRWRLATRAISATVLLGVGHVLEHLGRGGQVEFVLAEREVLGRHRPELQVRAPPRCPFAPELRVLEVDPDDASGPEPLRPLSGQHALAAADIEHGAGSGLGEQLLERASKPAISRRTTGFVEPYLS